MILEEYLYIYVEIDNTNEPIKFSKGAVKGETFSEMVDTVIGYERMLCFISYKIDSIQPHKDGAVCGNDLYLWKEKIGSYNINTAISPVTVTIELAPQYKNVELNIAFSEYPQNVVLLGKTTKMRAYQDGWLFYDNGKRRCVSIS